MTTKNAASVEAKRYTTLDGMRGIAAIAVAAFHLSLAGFTGPGFLGFVLGPKSAYLAVDFFFLLSGFVIAHAYEKRFAAGLTASSFFRARIIRLYPLYLAGTLLTISAAGVAIFVKHDSSSWTASSLGAAIPLAILMLPLPFGTNIFPLNVPAWSLFYELVVNATYAMRLFNKTWALYAIIAVSLVGVVCQAVIFGHVDQGAWWSSTFWALPRVFFSFPLGVVLYRLHHRVRVSASSPLVLLTLLAALMYMSPNGTGRVAFDLVFVLLISPLIVLIGSSGDHRKIRMGRFCETLGAASYPLYVIHFPVIAIAAGWMRRHPPLAPYAPEVGLALLVALVGVSLVAAVLDTRLRRVLTGRKAVTRTDFHRPEASAPR